MAGSASARHLLGLSNMIGFLATLLVEPALAAVAGAAIVTCPAVDQARPYTVTPAPSAGADWAACDLSYGDIAGADHSALM